MDQLTSTYLRQHTEPDANPPSTVGSWVTHSVHTEGTDTEGQVVVETLWRLRVSVRLDDGKDASPWSYTIRYFVEASHKLADGRLDWCPVTAYPTHDQALACIERQAQRLGVRIG